MRVPFSRGGVVTLFILGLSAVHLAFALSAAEVFFYFAVWSDEIASLPNLTLHQRIQQVEYDPEPVRPKPARPVKAMWGDAYRNILDADKSKRYMQGDVEIHGHIFAADGKFRMDGQVQLDNKLLGRLESPSDSRTRAQLSQPSQPAEQSAATRPKILGWVENPLGAIDSMGGVSYEGIFKPREGTALPSSDQPIRAVGRIYIEMTNPLKEAPAKPLTIPTNGKGTPLKLPDFKIGGKFSILAEFETTPDSLIHMEGRVLKDGIIEDLHIIIHEKSRLDKAVQWAEVHGGVYTWLILSFPVMVGVAMCGWSGIFFIFGI